VPGAVHPGATVLAVFVPAGAALLAAIPAGFSGVPTGPGVAVCVDDAKGLDFQGMVQPPLLL
jgi:hypothetical protein